MTDPDPALVHPRLPGGTRPARLRLPSWRRDALRTTFWVVPVLLIAVAVILFVATFEVDLAAFHHHLTLPWWVRTGSAGGMPRRAQMYIPPLTPITCPVM